MMLALTLLLVACGMLSQEPTQDEPIVDLWTQFDFQSIGSRNTGDPENLISKSEIIMGENIQLDKIDSLKQTYFFDPTGKSKILLGIINFKRKSVNNQLREKGVLINFKGKLLVITGPEITKSPFSYNWVRHGVVEFRIRHSNRESRKWRINLEDRKFIWIIPELIVFQTNEGEKTNTDPVK